MFAFLTVFFSTRQVLMTELCLASFTKRFQSLKGDHLIYLLKVPVEYLDMASVAIDSAFLSDLTTSVLSPTVKLISFQQCFNQIGNFGAPQVADYSATITAMAAKGITLEILPHRARLY